jgi:hypothetical protein
MHVNLFNGMLVFLLMLSVGCNRKTDHASNENSTDTVISPEKYDSSTGNRKHTKPEKEVIYGDTVWMYPYGNQTWHDTIATREYTAFISVLADTNDLLIDTVKSAKGNRIVVGYNHHYLFDFRKDKKPWFTLKFDKKNGLYPILYGTEFWQKSNLNIVDGIIFNQKFERFVIEMSVNSGDEISSMFYMIIDTQGKIEYLGTMSSWGGGGPDGLPFLTDDDKMYITCDELYNFTLDTAISLTAYAIKAHENSGIRSTAEYVQPHALRSLSHNNFLVIFNRFHNKPKYNALILNTDTLVIGHFEYFGLIEDIDAVLLYEDIDKLNRAFLYDTEREVLIDIKKDSIPVIEETGIYEMIKLVNDSILPRDVYSVDFGFYGPYEFYVSPNDSVIYFKEETAY